jgi:hypothetical protein
MYRITSQRGSWYSTEITTALPVADVKISRYLARGVWNFSQYFNFFLYLCNSPRGPPKILCEGTLDDVQYVLNANSVLDDRHTSNYD